MAVGKPFLQASCATLTSGAHFPAILVRIGTTRQITRRTGYLAGFGRAHHDGSGTMMRRPWWTAGASLATGLLALTALGVGTTFSGLPARAQQADVASLARRAIGGPGGEQSVTLLVGQLASNLLGLPLPEGTNIVGTVVRDLGNGMTGWEAVLDVPGAPMDAGLFFERVLPSLGWTPPPGTGETLGPGLFCQSEAGPWIAVIAVPVSDQASDVRIRIESGNPGPCAPQG